MRIVEITGWQKPYVARRPRDIIDFLLSKGGIQDYGGELRHMDLHRVQKGKFGRLSRRNGMSLDSARELAAEAGYLNPNSDINDLLQALYLSTHGQPTYSINDTNEVLAWEQAERDRHARDRDQSDEHDFWNPNNMFADL